MSGYVIVDNSTRSKRARVVNSKTGEAELTPFFKYPDQAMKFIVKHLRNSPAVTIKKVGI